VDTADQIVLQELVDGVRVAEERLARLGRAIEEFLPTLSLALIVETLRALRGVDLVTAATFVVEVGDVRRFESPRQLMGYLGLVPGERSTGETVRRGSITRMGNARVRHLLVESAWTYRHPSRVGAKKLPKLERVSPRIREIAWKAQSRLTARYRAFVARGKKTTVTCTAIARELAAFMWAVARGGPAGLSRQADPPTLAGDRRGTVVLASDASHCYENLEQGVSSRSSTARPTCSRATAVSGSSRRELIVPGHDLEVMRRHPPSDARLKGIAARLDLEPASRS
jgi:hypothetical protein